MRRLLWIAGVVLFPAAAMAAAPAGAGELGCGDRGRVLDSVYFHKQMEKRRPVALSTAPERGVRADIGDIAILEPGNGVVVSPNGMDLPGSTLRFVPADGGYVVAPSELRFDQTAADNGVDLALGDDDDTELGLPFLFPYFGETQDAVFVNSDGNLTFEMADSLSNARSLSRALAGPPRIFPLFTDLDATRPNAAVLAYSGVDRFVVTWQNVPEYGTGLSGGRTTFQVALYTDGAIEFHYQSVGFNDAIVGITPGDRTDAVEMLDLSDGSQTVSRGGFAEIFTGSRSIDINNAAIEFYRNHDDAYDVIVVFNEMGIPAGLSAFAFEVNVRNDVLGIGDIIPGREMIDFGRSFGSQRRLQSFINMGPMRNYPDDPNESLFLLPTNTALTVMSHEFGHRYLAYVQRRDPLVGSDSDILLGRQLAHWSFLFNTNASVMEGNAIEDRGVNAELRYVTTAATDIFSELDQYIMGFLPAEEVDPSFVVRDAVGPVFAGRAPAIGVNFNGTRDEVLVEEIIAAEGERVPHARVAQRDFRVGFLLVVRQGSQPSQEAIDRLERLRTEWEMFFETLTAGRARVETELVRDLHLSVWPAAGAIVGRDLPARVEIAAPRDNDLSVTVSRGDGGVVTPVVIPAGATAADFALRFDSPGSVAVTAEASSEGYAIARTLVDAQADFGSLNVEVESGSSQETGLGGVLPEPVVFRVLDQNRLPYAGLPVNVAASDNGVAQPEALVTGLDGRVRVSWTLSTRQTFNRLELTLVDAPQVTGSALARAVGPPPALSAAGNVNAASFNTGASAANAGLSPGSLVSIFGTDLGERAALAGAFPLPLQLEGARVRINGRSSPLLYSSPLQLNLQVPFGLGGDTATVTVTTRAGVSAPIEMPLATTQPGIFVAGEIGAILNNDDGSFVGDDPPSPGDIVQIFATGLGEVTPAAAAGIAAPASPLASTVAVPEVSIGIAAEVLSSTLAPGFAGLYQVNVRVPQIGPTMGTGTVGVQIRIDGRESNIVGMQIR